MSDTPVKNTIRQIQALGIDLALFWYILITIHRIILPAYTEIAAPQGIYWQFIYIGLAFIAALIFKISGLSPGIHITGLSANGAKAGFARHIYWITFCISIIAGWIITKVSPVDFFSYQGITGARNIFAALVTPELSIVDKALAALIETIYIALIATIIALPASFILSFLCARNLMKDNPFTFAVYTVIRLLSNFSRSVEPLIWAIIFSVWVGIGPFAGMLALMVHTIASLTKQYSEQIEDIDNGPLEAIEATGAHPLQIVWYAVIPQIVIPFLSFTIYRWDINVRMATIIGLVGGGGIGTMLMQYQGLAQWHEVGLIILMIALVVWVMDYISARVREALR